MNPYEFGGLLASQHKVAKKQAASVPQTVTGPYAFGQAFAEYLATEKDAGFWEDVQKGYQKGYNGYGGVEQGRAARKAVNDFFTAKPSAGSQPSNWGATPPGPGGAPNPMPPSRPGVVPDSSQTSGNGATAVPPAQPAGQAEWQTLPPAELDSRIEAARQRLYGGNAAPTQRRPLDSLLPSSLQPAPLAAPAPEYDNELSPDALAGMNQTAETLRARDAQFAAQQPAQDDLILPSPQGSMPKQRQPIPNVITKAKPFSANSLNSSGGNNTPFNKMPQLGDAGPGVKLPAGVR